MLCERCRKPVVNYSDSEGLCLECEEYVTNSILEKIPTMTPEELVELLDECDKVIEERIKQGKIKPN